MNATTAYGSLDSKKRSVSSQILAKVTDRSGFCTQRESIDVNLADWDPNKYLSLIHI